MAAIFFVTHPEVVIDPGTPVPDWPLSATGKARMQAFAESPVVRQIGTVFSSAERKAMDGAGILADRLGLTPQVEPDLHENDRSATGFLPPDQFWPVVEAFFAKPEESVRGWERAADAQARIAGAVERVRNTASAEGDIAIIAHGGVGGLLLAHLKGTPISRGLDQPHGGGGCYLTLSRETGALLDGWRIIGQ